MAPQVSSDILWKIIQHGPTGHTTHNAKQFSEADEKPTPGQSTPHRKRKGKKKTREKKIKEGEPDTAAAALARFALPLRVFPHKSRPPPPLPCTPSPRRRSPQPLALIAPRPRLVVAPSRSPPRRRGEHPRARPSTAWLVDCLLCSFHSDSIRFDPRRRR